MKNLYTYEVYGNDTNDRSIIGWRKTSKAAGDFAGKLAKFGQYNPIIIKRRERRPEDF